MRIKRLISVFMMVLLVLGCVMCEQDIKAKTGQIKLSKKSVKLVSKDTYKLRLKGLPAKAKVTWSVVKGKGCIKLVKKKRSYAVIKPLKNGTARVRATVKLPTGKQTKLKCSINIKLPDEEKDIAPSPEPTASPQVSGSPSATYKQITQAEAMQMMGKDDGHVIVDVRTEAEYNEGHILGAILIPNESIAGECPELLPDKEQIILIYCRSGRRSKEAAQKLADMGYVNIYEFGGINTWPGAIVK